MIDFPGTTIADIHHHIIAIFKKKPNYIIVYVGTNDVTITFRTCREVLHALLQLKNTFFNTQ